MKIFDAEELSIKQTLNQLNNFIGGSIIASLNKLIQFTDEPYFYGYQAEINDFKKYSDAPSDNDTATGLSLDENIAKIKSLSEAIERFCLSLYRKKNLKRASFLELKNKAIDPILFLKFPESQFKISREKILKKLHNYPFYWTKVSSIERNKQIYIPAQLVYVPYHLDSIVIQNPISTGAAAGSSYSAAIYRGICEVVERDSFMITYLSKNSAPKIDTKSIKNKKIKNLLKYYERYFLELHLFDITTDVNIPTVLSIIIDRTGIGPAVCVGTKSDLNYEKAILDSIEEAQKVRNWMRCLMIINPVRFNKLKNNPSEIKSMADRGLFWAHKENIKKINFLLNSKNKTKVRNTKCPNKIITKLKIIIKLMQKAGMSIYIKNLTPKNPSTKPFKIVKVIIPEAHPLFLSEKLPYFWSERLFKTLTSLKNKNLKINKFPHPFV